jgi:GntR family transcriptional repressor for pyruvate dehydrogenase complex
MTPDRRVRPKRLYEDVAAELMRLIRNATYPAGEALPTERELMEMFGVGRPAVREALFSLSKMGLVEVRSGMAARVTKPTADRLIGELSGVASLLLADDDGIRMFQDARKSFEVSLARYAAEFATAADIERLEQALIENRAGIGDLERFAESDVAFHFELALIRRNALFIALQKAVVEWLTEQRHVALQAEGEDAIAFKAHKAVFDAIARHDPDKAQRAMTSHLDQIVGVYWSNKRN